MHACERDETLEWFIKDDKNMERETDNVRRNIWIWPAGIREVLQSKWISLKRERNQKRRIGYTKKRWMYGKWFIGKTIVPLTRIYLSFLRFFVLLREREICESFIKKSNIKDYTLYI